MAEIRKHNPKVTGEIDRALLAALGEDVRPVTPGSKPAVRTTTEQQDAFAGPAGTYARPGAATPAFGMATTGSGWVTVNPGAARVSEPDSVVDPDDVYPDERGRHTDDEPAGFDEDYR